MFDSTKDLLDKIRLGEDSFLELKEVRFAGDRVTGPNRTSLADELAAFANARGGVCVLGVDDGTKEILVENSEELSGVRPEYRAIDDAELLLVIPAAQAGVA